MGDAKFDYKVERKTDGHFEIQNPENRRAIFLGDLTDRGSNSPDVLRLVMDILVVFFIQMNFLCNNVKRKLVQFIKI